MQIDGHIQALREELTRVASLGDEAAARAAELLSMALESSLARHVQDILAEAALEPRRTSSSSRNRLTGYGRS